MKKRTARLTFSALCAAGAVIVLILGRVLPTGQLAMAAVASLFTAAAAKDCGKTWGLATFVVAAVLALLLVPDVTTWLYVLFFGYYPVVKLFLEEKLPTAVAWVVKYVVFAAAGFGVWHLLFADGGRSVVLLAAVGAIVFAVFDVGYTRLIKVYEARFSRKR